MRHIARCNSDNSCAASVSPSARTMGSTRSSVFCCTFSSPAFPLLESETSTRLLSKWSIVRKISPFSSRLFNMAVIAGRDTPSVLPISDGVISGLPCSYAWHKQPSVIISFLRSACGTQRGRKYISKCRMI